MKAVEDGTLFAALFAPVRWQQTLTLHQPASGEAIGSGACGLAAACSPGVQVRVSHFAHMSNMNRHRTAVDVHNKRPGSTRPDPTPQFIRLRPALKGRELTVLDAVTRLPAQYRTPTAAATQMTLDGIDIPFSTLCAILRRLESKGALRLGRAKD